MNGHWVGMQLEESDDELWGEDAVANSDSDDSQGEQDYPDTEEDDASMTEDGACEHAHFEAALKPGRRGGCVSE